MTGHRKPMHCLENGWLDSTFRSARPDVRNIPNVTKNMLDTQSTSNSKLIQTADHSVHFKLRFYLRTVFNQNVTSGLWVLNFLEN